LTFDLSRLIVWLAKGILLNFIRATKEHLFIRSIGSTYAFAFESSINWFVASSLLRVALNSGEFVPKKDCRGVYVAAVRQRYFIWRQRVDQLKASIQSLDHISADTQKFLESRVDPNVQRGQTP